MLNICHFANTIVGKSGNIGVRTERIIRGLSGNGDRGYCVSRMSQLRSPSFVYRDMGWLGHIPRILNAIRIYAAPGFNHRYPDIKLFEWFALRQLPEILSTTPYIAHVWDACPRLMQALKSAGCPVVLDMPVAPTAYSLCISQEYGLDFLMIHQSMLDFEQEAFELADVIAAPSQFVADELIAVGVPLEKIRVIEFGVDIPAETEKKIAAKNQQSVDFCFVGNINRRKGVDLLLTAWNSPEFKDDRLHLCGRVFPEVKQHIADNRGGLVLTPGFIKPFDYLQNCDVFVFPSWLEGSAKAIYEAMACGLPVITTHSSGSVVRDGIDGFVIDTGDLNALRERMLWFKENPEKIIEMGHAANQRVREFSWERYGKRIIDLYSQLAQ